MAARSIVRASVALAVLAGSGAVAAAPTQEEMLAELKRLAERVERLEKRNAELESRLAAGKTAGGGEAEAALAARVEALEAANRELSASLENDRISDLDPELIARLKAVESQSQSYQQQARTIEALEGITAEASVVSMAQRVNGGARTDGKPETQLNWRGDVSVTLPGGEIGNARGKLFTHIRLGQGSSFTRLKPTFTGALNSTAFQLIDRPGGFDGDRNPANDTALLAQAWYQLDVPLPLGGFAAASREHLEINVGKMDPFVFFDQNTIADNEAVKFVNNVFVHNPMLDSGGAMGIDDYGFTPGLRVAYHSDQGKPEWWRASVGAFGAGEGATFGRSFTQPMVIGQLEFGRRFFGLEGNYRLYAWRNGQYQGFDFDSARNNFSSTTGWGASLDQRVADDVTVFARYGHTTSGKVAFDRAATLGAEILGNAWSRGADSIGIAWGWLRSSDGFRAVSTSLLDDDGNPLYARAADGAEQIAELYYRWRLNANLSLTPDLQYVRRPGADRDAKDVTAAGVRALYAF